MTTSHTTVAHEYKRGEYPIKCYETEGWPYGDAAFDEWAGAGFPDIDHGWVVTVREDDGRELGNAAHVLELASDAPTVYVGEAEGKPLAKLRKSDAVRAAVEAVITPEEQSEAKEDNGGDKG